MDTKPVNEQLLERAEPAAHQWDPVRAASVTPQTKTALDDEDDVKNHFWVPFGALLKESASAPSNYSF